MVGSTHQKSGKVHVNMGPEKPLFRVNTSFSFHGISIVTSNIRCFLSQSELGASPDKEKGNEERRGNMAARRCQVNQFQQHQHCQPVSELVYNIQIQTLTSK
jgi:hypothetical protein